MFILKQHKNFIITYFINDIIIIIIIIIIKNVFANENKIIIK